MVRFNERSEDDRSQLGDLV